MFRGGGVFVFFGGLSLTALAAVPYPPDAFAVGAKSACAVDLIWKSSPTPNVRYSIEYTTAGDFTSGVQPVLTTDTLSVGDTHSGEHLNLPINSVSNYRYHIQAVDKTNGANVSSWLNSTPAMIKTTTLVTPVDPSKLVVVGKSAGKQAELKWDSPALSPYGEFEIWRSEDNITFAKINPTAPLGNFYTDGVPGSYLDTTKVYYYKVRSFESDYGCVAGDKLYSGYSKTVTVPMMPTSLTALYQFRPSQVNLNWTNGTGQDYYEVWHSKNTDPFTLLKNVGVVTSYEDSSIIANQKYSYKVRGCTTSGGCSDFSNVSSVMIASAPQNPTAQIYYVNGTKGNVRISWDNTFPSSFYGGIMIFTGLLTVALKLWWGASLFRLLLKPERSTPMIIWRLVIHIPIA